MAAHHLQAVPLPARPPVNHVSLHTAGPDMPRIFYCPAESATDQNYLPVINFLQVYSSAVREIEW